MGDIPVVHWSETFGLGLRRSPLVAILTLELGS